MSPDETLGETQAGADVSTEPRRPYWAVGLVLLAVVLVVLAAAFLLDRQLRPRVGIEPSPTVPALAQSFETRTAAPSPTPAVSASPTARAGAAEPTLAASPTGPRVANSPLEREIEQAYLKYWEIRSEALYNLDPSRLPDVMAGAELEREQQQISELKAQGRAVKIDVEHRIAFVRVGEANAELYDEYVNRSYLVDAQTKQPIRTPGPGGTAKVSYRLQKIDGVWKVVDGQRFD